VQQIATPSELYEQPSSRFVADFIGKVNLIDATVTKANGKNVTCNAKAIGKLELPSDKSCSGAIAIAVRPEKLKIATAEPKGAGVIKAKGEVRDVAYYGDTSRVVVAIKDGIDLDVNVQNEKRMGGTGIARGDKVWVHWSPDDTLVLTE
jgi:ABC-type Fe3+/spermidine/putrescine transport system ATPase subunit